MSFAKFANQELGQVSYGELSQVSSQPAQPSEVSQMSLAK